MCAPLSPQDDSHSSAAAFVGDLEGDPLDLIELGYQLEAAFNVRLTPSQRDSLPTVRSVVDFFRARK